MRCTNNRKRVFKRKRQRKRRRFPLGFVIPAAVVIALSIIILWPFSKYVFQYEAEFYNQNVDAISLPVDTFCVTNEDVTDLDFQLSGDVHAAALFDISAGEVVYAKDVHERLYPASTTKLLTAYVALKYGKLDDIVTVSKQAVGVPWDSSRAGLQVGDELTLETLLYALMLPSGNDSAVAIAEYISGSEKEFAELLNREASLLGATNTHFVNAHGYHDEKHYTTAYDLHLIMKACTTQEELMRVLSTDRYDAQITQANGTYRNVTWHQTNQYVIGSQSAPDDVTVIGGKTGTTDQAGSCLVLYSVSSDNEKFVSIVMGADDKSRLYKDMTGLLMMEEK